MSKCPLSLNLLCFSPYEVLRENIPFIPCKRTFYGEPDSYGYCYIYYLIFINDYLHNTDSHLRYLSTLCLVEELLTSSSSFFKDLACSISRYRPTVDYMRHYSYWLKNLQVSVSLQLPTPKNPHQINAQKINIIVHVLPFGEETLENIRRLLSNATVSVIMAHILFVWSEVWIRVSPE